MLDQIRRAGDVNCITYSQATKVVQKCKREGCPNNPQYTILVLGAKTTSSGKLTPNEHPPSLFQLFRNYTEFLRSQFRTSATSTYLTVSEVSVDRLQPGSITKKYRRPWKRLSEELGRPLPKLTASNNRAMNVTETARRGETSEHMEGLAQHMSQERRTQTSLFNDQNSNSSSKPKPYSLPLP